MSGSEHDERLLALYETVEGLTDVTKALLKETKAQIEQSAFENSRIVKQVEIEAQAQLLQINDVVENALLPEVAKSRELATQTLDAAEAKAKQWIFRGVAVSVAFMVATFLVCTYVLTEAYEDHRAYWDKEVETAFGVRAIENENGRFLIVDEAYRLGSCSESYCVSVEVNDAQ